MRVDLILQTSQMVYHVCGACSLIGLSLSIKRRGLITRMIIWVHVDIGVQRI
jgi:hypothetical protein